MSSNLPVPAIGTLPWAVEEAVRTAVDAAHPGVPAHVLSAMDTLREGVRDAGSAARRADKHVQKWREGMATMTLEVALRDDPNLDEAFRLIQGTQAWKLLVATCLESPRIMAELRSYWKPDDKVEIRD